MFIHVTQYNRIINLNNISRLKKKINGQENILFPWYKIMFFLNETIIRKIYMIYKKKNLSRIIFKYI